MCHRILSLVLRWCTPLVIFCLIACSGRVDVPKAQTVNPSKPCSDSALRSQSEEFARLTGGRVGVAISLIDNDEAVLINGQQHFPMQSVYKLPIGMAVLKQVDQGKLTLDQKVRVKPIEYVRLGQHSPIRDKYPKGAELSLAEILRLAVSESDGTASDVLMRVAGGATAVMGYLRDLRVDGIMVLDTEKEIGKAVEVQYRNWATPEGALALLKAVAEGGGLSPESHKLLMRLITETPTGMKRIKGSLPAGTVVAHKTGTGGTIGGLTRAVNDIGLITLPNGQRLAIAIFVSDARVDVEGAEAVIAKISRAAWDCAAANDKGAQSRSGEGASK